MFSELKLRNFQSISEANLKLGRINVIVGPSYLGKSAIIRAIHAITRNRFESSFMKRGTSFTKIQLVEGDKVVQYNRDQNTSSYIWSGNKESYTKIGRDVPQDIRNFFQMDEILFDEGLSLDFNIQRQFDPAFIISLSGFEVAKVFGKLMNLDIVLSASREISKDIQGLNKKKDECLAVQDVSIKYIQSHCSIELKNSLLQSALTLESEADTLECEAERLFDIISELEILENKILNYSKFLDDYSKAKIDSVLIPKDGFEDTLVNLIYEEERQKVYNEILNLTIPDFDFNSFISFENILVDYIIVSEKEKNFASVMADILDIDFSYLESIFDLESAISEATSINSSFVERKNELSSIKSQIVQKHTEFDDFIKENNICPIIKKAFAPLCIEFLKEGIE